MINDISARRYSSNQAKSSVMSAIPRKTSSVDNPTISLVSPSGIITRPSIDAPPFDIGAVVGRRHLIAPSTSISARAATCMTPCFTPCSHSRMSRLAALILLAPAVRQQ